MTRQEIRRLRVRVGLGANDKSQDEILKMLYDEATGFILAYTRRNPKQWLKAFDWIRVQLMAFYYAKHGEEGILRRREGEVSTEFADEGKHPANMVKALNPFRLIKGL